VTATTTSRGLPVVCRTNPALTVDVPAVNVVVAVPDGVVVCAVVVIVLWFGTAFEPVLMPAITKVAVPMLLLLSVAVTVEFTLGAWTYAMNEPPAFAYTVAGTVVTTVPPTWITIAEPAANPSPMIWTVVPAWAATGSVRVGAVTAKVAVAVLLAASVIVNVLVATEVTGTVNDAAIPPVELVLVMFRVTATPLTFAVSALVGANPDPATVIVVPLLAVVGKTTIDGVTWIADWTVKPVFESVRVSR
jgi:hypothetical protein